MCAVQGIARTEVFEKHRNETARAPNSPASGAGTLKLLKKKQLPARPKHRTSSPAIQPAPPPVPMRTPDDRDALQARIKAAVAVEDYAEAACLKQQLDAIVAQRPRTSHRRSPPALQGLAPERPHTSHRRSPPALRAQSNAHERPHTPPALQPQTNETYSGELSTWTRQLDQPTHTPTSDSLHLPRMTSTPRLGANTQRRRSIGQ